jgi:hypothetical protein
MFLKRRARDDLRLERLFICVFARLTALMLDQYNFASRRAQIEPLPG